MNVSEYAYDFPEEAIAIYPPEVRGTTKLFVIDTHRNTFEVTQYSQLLAYLSKGDCIVRNNTKVFRARMHGKLEYSQSTPKKSREVEVFLIEPHAQSLEEYVSRVYDKSKNGFRLAFMGSIKKSFITEDACIILPEQVVVRNIVFTGDSFEGVFTKMEGTFTPDALFSMIEKYAEVPLPPYINRLPESLDVDRYQTVFAKYKGSVAAPTASLNFTKEMEQEAQQRGVLIEDITLHVGRGTFLPLKSETIEDNVLHTEPYFISDDTAHTVYAAKARGNRVCALGTTVTRTLESSKENIMRGKGAIGDTSLFIYPPYDFGIVSALLTNFHFPKSSLITLVDAFLQHKKSVYSWREIYSEAIQKYGAKLFSYGDSMLVL